MDIGLERLGIGRSAIPIRASFLTVSIDKKIERRECTPDYLANTYECQFDNFYPSHERISKDEKEGRAIERVNQVKACLSHFQTESENLQIILVVFSSRA